jgi:hypothetical protein
MQGLADAHQHPGIAVPDIELVDHKLPPPRTDGALIPQCIGMLLDRRQMMAAVVLHRQLVFRAGEIDPQRAALRVQQDIVGLECRQRGPSEKQPEPGLGRGIDPDANQPKRKAKQPQASHPVVPAGVVLQLREWHARGPGVVEARMFADQVVGDDHKVIQAKGPGPGQIQQCPRHGRDRYALHDHDVVRRQRRAVPDDTFPTRGGGAAAGQVQGPGRRRQHRMGHAARELEGVDLGGGVEAHGVRRAQLSVRTRPRQQGLLPRGWYADAAAGHMKILGLGPPRGDAVQPGLADGEGFCREPGRQGFRCRHPPIRPQGRPVCGRLSTAPAVRGTLTRQGPALRGQIRADTGGGSALICPRGE